MRLAAFSDKPFDWLIKLRFYYLGLLLCRHFRSKKAHAKSLVWLNWGCAKGETRPISPDSERLLHFVVTSQSGRCA